MLVFIERLQRIVIERDFRLFRFARPDHGLMSVLKPVGIAAVAFILGIGVSSVAGISVPGFGVSAEAEDPKVKQLLELATGNVLAAVNPRSGPSDMPGMVLKDSM